MLELFGRLHPLLLHLPIGMLAIAFLMQLAKKDSLQPAIGFALKWGAIAALASAASGYFLSQEGGYDETLLFWHKWLGLATTAFCLLVYFLHKSGNKVYFPVFAATMALLAGAGHFGGSLTHGSDFLLEPFREKEPTPTIADVGQAHLYQDIIRPIFNEKCNACHNASKQKGELLTNSPEGLLKGGKTGALFVAGNPGQSLLFERIHLDEGDKKHMPPKGKKQLSPDEIKLLQWWVAAGADFEKKVADSNAPAEIVAILEQYAKPLDDPGVMALKVSAAGANKAARLQESGFEVRPVAMGSPFLEAVFPKKKELTKGDLKQLKRIADQLIWLDLNGSGLNDAMMAVIGDLPHLQKLSLQNTQLTDKGLTHLEGLEYLEHLNLYGTAVTDAGLARFPALPRLRHLYLWQTQTSEKGMAALKNRMPYLQTHLGADESMFGDAALMPPLIVAEKDMFEDTMSVELKLNFKGAEVFYTLDGSAPDSNSLRYDGKPLLLRSSTEVKAFAKKAGWKSSEVAGRFFPRAKYKIAQLQTNPKPNDRYKGKGAATLHDYEKGSLSFTDNKWLGFEKSHATLVIDLGQVQEVSRVTVGAMENTGSYIFFPKAIEVSASENGTRYASVVSKTYPTASAPLPPELANLSESFAPVQARFLKIAVKSNLVNPDWHPAPGAPCWIFLDEVIVE